jgi:hypothetical protein
VSADLAQRASIGHKSAYDIMLDLVDEAEDVRQARQAVANVASLPIRMTELRSMVQSTSRGDHKLLLRALRRDLELEFRRRLFERIGEISADDPRPLDEILNEVGDAARSLRPHMSSFALQLLDEHVETPAADANG